MLKATWIFTKRTTYTDEVQLIPDLFKTLRELLIDVTDREAHAQFLLLGSASRLLQHFADVSGESVISELTPVYHFGNSTAWSVRVLPDKLWLRGGFPQSYSHQPTNKAETGDRFYFYCRAGYSVWESILPPPDTHCFWQMLSFSWAAGQ
jgi:predicted AAA+ superfamily ATPase